MVELKRERIVQEVITRLKTISSSNSDKVPVNRGWKGINVDKIPSIYVFEDEERASLGETRHGGLYKKVLPIQIEYFACLSNQDELYVLNNTMIVSVVNALEIDRNLQEGGSDEKKTGGEHLVNSFGMTRNMTWEVKEGTIDLIIIYEFEYSESFGTVRN